MTCDFEERHANIFDEYDAYEAVALCVSEEIRLNRGISALFKQRFGGVTQLQSQKKKVGHVVHQLRKYCAKFNVKTLAIPYELGEGLEVLESKFVKEILIKTFGGWDGKLIMYRQ